MKKFLILLSVLSAASSFAYDIKFYSEDDDCQGAPDGEILILSDSSGNPICRKMVADKYITQPRIWSVSVGGKCMDISDTSDAQAVCNLIIKK